MARFREAAASWRGAGGRVIMCREMYHPSDYPGADGEPLEDVVAHHPPMSGRDNAEFYLVEPEDLVMRKTGFLRSCGRQPARDPGRAPLGYRGHRGWPPRSAWEPLLMTSAWPGLKVVILEDACASQALRGILG